MEGSFGEYIFVAVIISILANLIISRIGNLIRLRRDRERRANTPIPDMRPYHVPENNTPSIPPQPQNNAANARPVRRNAIAFLRCQSGVKWLEGDQRHFRLAQYVDVETEQRKTD